MENQVCQRCNQPKPIDFFYRSQKWCKDCKNKQRRQARRARLGCYKNEYKDNKIKHLETCKRRHGRNKLKVMAHYSDNKNCCVRCGFNDMRALSIDHINSDGYIHRKDKTVQGSGLYLWLIRHDFPKDFQVLCMNCQFIKRAENQEVQRNDLKITCNVEEIGYSGECTQMKLFNG